MSGEGREGKREGGGGVSERLESDGGDRGPNTRDLVPEVKRTAHAKLEEIDGWMDWGGGRVALFIRGGIIKVSLLFLPWEVRGRKVMG